MIGKEERRQLDEVGYVSLPRVADDELLANLRSQVEELFQREGDKAGYEFKQEEGARRLANLVNKGRVFQDLIAQPDVLSRVSHVLNGQVKLSSLNARSVNAHWHHSQPLHCDMGAVPDEKGNWVCNAVWVLDAFTADNGALRVIPGSHCWNRLPQDVLDDPTADHPDQVLLTAAEGSVIVMNAHLWHSGLGNRTDRPRTAVHAFYCRTDKPQQQYQKRLLSATVQASLPPHLRNLLALDDPLNDELAAREVTRSGFLR